jgi:hypothetical protein
MGISLEQAKAIEEEQQKDFLNKVGFSQKISNIFNPAVDYVVDGGLSDFYTRLNAGFDVSDDEIRRHRLNKNIGYGGGKAGYKHITTNSVPVSDATDGYHIRSGIDFGNLATGDSLPGGGLPAAISGIAYQQLMGLGDGTVGKNAFLQSVDNITGLRESGKAPALDNLYKFGSNMYNLFNQPSTPNLDITALGGPRAKGNFTRGKINVEDYSTKVARIQAKKEAEARARAQAEAQARAQQVISQRQQQQAQQQQQKQYQTKMADVYKNVTVDNSGNKGYTGTGSQGRGAYYQTPKYRGQQAAAAIDAKAKSMGVASPVRRTPGSKYGFGL